MALNEIKKFIEDTNSFLNDIPDDIINNYIIDDFDLPTYFNWEFEYDELKVIYTSINSKILEAKHYILNNDEAENVIFDLIVLRRLTEKLIKTHYDDKGRFEKENDILLKVGNDELNFFQFTSKKKYQKLSILKKIYLLLISENRLNKNSNQRKAFISLFYSEKIINDKINWNGFDSDLRGFLVAMIDIDIILFNSSDINKFASNNFKTLNKGGVFSSIDSNVFRTYQDKEPFHKSKESWIKLLTFQLR